MEPESKAMVEKELNQEQEKLVAAKKTWQTGSQEFKLARNRWFRAVRTAKRECWETFMQSSNSETIWRAINAKPQASAMPQYLMTRGGQKATTHDQKAAAIAEVSFPSSSSSSTTYPAQSATSHNNSVLNEDAEDSLQICTKTLHRMLQKMSN